MIINKIHEFIKGSLPEKKEEALYRALLVILIALCSFGLGVLSEREENFFPVKILGLQEDIQSEKLESPTPPAFSQEVGLLVGSKNGNKYHLPWCSGASRIKEENKIWFSSQEEAEKMGYTPAGNCPGI